MRSFQITCLLSSWLANLRRRLSNEGIEPRQAGFSRSCDRREANLGYFHFVWLVQPLLISLHAGRRAESHRTVATGAGPERTAAMVATDCHERCVPELAG